MHKASFKARIPIKNKSYTSQLAAAQCWTRKGSGGQHWEHPKVSFNLKGLSRESGHPSQAGAALQLATGWEVLSILHPSTPHSERYHKAQQGFHSAGNGQLDSSPFSQLTWEKGLISLPLPIWIRTKKVQRNVSFGDGHSTSVGVQTVLCGLLKCQLPRGLPLKGSNPIKVFPTNYMLSVFIV